MIVSAANTTWEDSNFLKVTTIIRKIFETDSRFHVK